MGFSIYDLLSLNEAEDDDNTAQEDNQGEQDQTEDQNFDIDANLDSGDAQQGQDATLDLDNNTSNNKKAVKKEEPDEPVEANTDIFSSLTKEEQQIKIRELKKMYADLYSSCDDILSKLNGIEDDNALIELSKISDTLYSLKSYIMSYLSDTFQQKSYVENDIMFNRFLDVINTISICVDKMQKENDNSKK